MGADSRVVRRGVLVGELMVDGRPVRVATTHLDVRSEKIRVEQWREAMGVLRDNKEPEQWLTVTTDRQIDKKPFLSEKDIPLFVCGDFNALSRQDFDSFDGHA